MRTFRQNYKKKLEVSSLVKHLEASVNMECFTALNTLNACTSFAHNAFPWWHRCKKMFKTVRSYSINERWSRTWSVQAEQT